ncbi:MAG: hypothetical protein WA151_17400, partial [Desulfatirhabdiaceae bacterium]
DLENHLKEESETITRRKIMKPDPVQEPGTPSSGETADGSVNQERLESDNQVMRALEMLISYDVFKDLKN